MKLSKLLIRLILSLTLCIGSSATLAEVVAVVSAKNPLTTLSKDQLADLFLGKTSRFPDGTLAEPIDQAEGAPARDEFYLEFADRSPAQIKAHWAKIIFTGRGQPPKTVPNGAAMKKRLADDANAIGYLERKNLDGSVKALLIQ